MPIGFLTMGLVAFVINAAMLLGTAWAVNFFVNANGFEFSVGGYPDHWGYAAIGCAVVIIDANDLGRVVLGKSDPALSSEWCGEVFKDNPLGPKWLGMAIPIAKILKAPSIATEGVKEYVSRAMDMDIHGAVDFARNLHATINASSEMKK